MMGVGGQKLQGLLVVLHDANLLEDGIGLYVDADRTGHVLLTQARGAAHIDEGIGFAIEPVESPTLEPVALVVDQVLVRPSEEHTSELRSRENLVCRLL